MNIIISNRSGDPIYTQIEKQIQSAIVSGELKEGEMLPSMRGLAKELGISIITTKRAYEELEKSGFIQTVAGKGCFVAPQNMELVKENNLKKIEELLSQAIEIALISDISSEEIKDMVDILYTGE